MSNSGSTGTGLESTLYSLMEMESKHGIEQGNMLIMISLVNLMGLVNLVGHRMGVQMSIPPVTLAPGEKARATANAGNKRAGEDATGKDGPGMSPQHLANLLGALLGPPPGGPRPPAPGPMPVGKPEDKPPELTKVPPTVPKEMA